MAHGDAQEGKWRENWRMEWVASTLHTTSEHDVSSITTADAHTSAASSQLNWRPRRFKWTRPFCRKTNSGFYACAITFQTQYITRLTCLRRQTWLKTKLSMVCIMEWSPFPCRVVSCAHTRFQTSFQFASSYRDADSCPMSSSHQMHSCDGHVAFIVRPDVSDQCFSNFVRPQPGKFFFFLKDEGPVPANLLVNTFPILSSYIKLT